MVQSKESQKKAHTNGAAIEHIVQTFFPDVDFDSRRIIDLNVNGIPVEIKSCQKTITDNNNSSSKRSGRFILNSQQHQELIENAGEYIFIVHENTYPVIFLKIPAYKVNVGDFSGIKGICWKTLISEAIV